jgi:hypothetical protein
MTFAWSLVYWFDEGRRRNVTGILKKCYEKGEIPGSKEADGVVSPFRPFF